METQLDLLEEFGRYLREHGKQPATINSYLQDAKSFLRYLQASQLSWQQVEPQTLLYFQEHLQAQHGKANSIRRMVIGIRQYFRFLAHQNNWPSSPLDTLPLPQRQDDLASVLDAEVIERLIQAAAQGAMALKAARDAAIIPLLAYEGLKVTELIQLRWSDFIVADGLGSLRIAGPRGRVLLLRPESSQRLSLYQSCLHSTLPYASHAELYQRMFLSFKGRENLRPMPRISRHGLKFMLYDLGSSVGLTHLHSESLRHFAIHLHLSLGRTPEEIMQHFGLRRVGNIGKHLALDLRVRLKSRKG